VDYAITPQSLDGEMYRIDFLHYDAKVYSVKAESTTTAKGCRVYTFHLEITVSNIGHSSKSKRTLTFITSIYNTYKLFRDLTQEGGHHFQEVCELIHCTISTHDENIY
jgi:hypothetical protein